VIGAGASAEVGMPLWSELIERLLLRALGPETPPSSDEYPAEILAAAKRVLSEKGTLEAATMARAALGGRFTEELRVCLYEWQEKWNWNQPGATAHAVAGLYELMFEHGQSCEVLTTNYDLTLEKAIEEVSDAPVRSMCSDLEDPDGLPVVRHLHGILTPDGEAEEVALTEDDYHKVDSEGIPWQESHLRKRFRDSTVVFIGASLTDEHLLRYIVRYATVEKPPIALLVRAPDEADPIDVHSEPDATEELCTTLEEARWAHLRLTVLEASFPSQPAQFLFEVANHKGGREVTRYGNRLDQWYRDVRVDPLGLVSAAQFESSQTALQRITANWLAALSSVLSQDGFDLSEEALEVHLWVRCPDRIHLGEEPGEKAQLSSLAMIGCSDRIWRDPRAIDVRLVTQPSSRAAVDAFCWGTPQIQLPGGRPKWAWILATPVVLGEDSGYGRLPVGAVTLVSDRALEKSVLGRLREENPRLLTEIERFLSDAAADLLAS
jgi:SIR2-like domain